MQSIKPDSGQFLWNTTLKCWIVSDSKFTTAKVLIPEILNSVETKLTLNASRRRMYILMHMGKCLCQNSLFRGAEQPAWWRKGLDARQVAVAVEMHKSHIKYKPILVSLTALPFYSSCHSIPATWTAHSQNFYWFSSQAAKEMKYIRRTCI